MGREAQRAHFTGPALVRLLARLAGVDAPALQPATQPAFAQRLSDWLGWTDAIALSSALNAPSPSPARTRPGARSAEADLARVRQALAKGIVDDTAAAPRDALLDPAPTFAPFRRSYAARQQAMEAGIGALRGRLREAVAAASPARARLAAVDAVMEQALGAQERTLLWTVPSLLERHFDRLRAAQGPDGPEGWLRVFCQDMQAVLLAELDIRLQPVEGLLEALRDE